MNGPHPPRVDGTGRRRRTVTGLLLAGSSLIVSLFLAELALRGLGLGPTSGGFTVSERDFDRIPGIWEPGQAGIVTDHDRFPHYVSINDLGYRGRDFEREKPDGQFRILYVGDSFTFGAHVADEESLPEQLQDRLAARCDDILVVNGGLGGSTLTEHKEIIRRALTIDPDLVILQFTETDLRDLRGTVLWERLRQNREAKSRFPMNMIYPLARRSALWRLILKARAVARERATATPAPSRGPATSDPPPGDPLRAEYATHLDEIDALLAEHDLPLVFVAYPSHLTINGTLDGEQVDWVTGLATQHAETVVDLRSALEESGLKEEELFLLPWDGHPSPRAYELASAQVEEGLVSSGLLPSSCATTAS